MKKMGRMSCPVYFNSQITLKQLKDNGGVLPGRRWADSQLAGQPGRRLPFSVALGGGLISSGCSRHRDVEMSFSPKENWLPPFKKSNFDTLTCTFFVRLFNLTISALTGG